MKKLLLLSLLSISMVGSMAGLASATPSNIIRVPSADIQPFGTFHLDIDNNTTMFRPVSSGGGSTPTTFGLSAGTFDAGILQMEAGVDVREPNNDPVSFHGKIAIPEGAINEVMPAIYFGVFDVGTKTDVSNYNIMYAGVSKTFSFVGRFSVGYFTGNGHLLTKSSGKKDNTGLMASFDTRLPKINERLWIGIDYMGTNSQYGATSVGFSWAFSENASITVAHINYADKTVTPPDSSGTAVGQNMISWQVDFDF